MNSSSNPGGSSASAPAAAPGQTALGAEAAGNGSASGPAEADALVAWFGEMLDHCYDYAQAAKAQGRPVVGILCEFTPRELILAAGGVPVSLCGGSAATIPAAERHLPANVCPLIKSTFGYHVKKSNPFLEWADLVVAETTCDGKKKMFEQMAATRPMYVLELPQKSENADALAHWEQEVRKLQRRLEQQFHVQLTADKLRDAIRLMNRERGLRRQLAGLMALDSPPLTGRQLLEFKSIISGIDSDLRQYERALKVLGNGGAARGSLKAGAAPKTAVRVLLTGVPLVHGAERVLELIEKGGAVVVALENCTGLKPILEDVDESDPDPIAAIARKYYHLGCSVMTRNDRRLASLRTLAAHYRPQCVIDLVWQSCLTYDIESYHVRQLAEAELHLPYLKITTDYSPADSARIAGRVEALLETVRLKAARAARRASA